MEFASVKVYLDDERPTPEGWLGVRWPEEAVALLKTGRVEEISLDHDLGDDERGTGYEVLLWLEEVVVLHGFPPPAMRVHSANSSARVKMRAAIDQIERLAARRSAPIRVPLLQIEDSFRIAKRGVVVVPDLPVPEGWKNRDALVELTAPGQTPRLMMVQLALTHAQLSKGRSNWRISLVFPSEASTFLKKRSRVLAPKDIAEQLLRPEQGGHGGRSE